MINKKEQIKKILKEHKYFQECILDDIVISNFGTTIILTFNNIWTNELKIRQDLNEKSIVKLKFTLVNNFIINNALSISITNEPSKINWGFNEVSSVNFIENDNLAPDFYQVEILWETKRKFKIEFVNLELI